MGSFLYRWVPLLARLLTIPIFLYSGWTKFLSPGQTAVYIAGTFVTNLGMAAEAVDSPLWRYLGLAAGAIEIMGALLLLAGWRTRFGALLLIVYLIPVTVIFHVFGWASAMHAQAAHVQALSLFKNLAIVAALLQLATYGPGRPSVDVRD
jgi:putative oxidoreductase